MAALSRAQSKHMYSWWWDSHISPKNSKWLQQNLTEMDGKVKTMIKLIEVDEDSFARRAEMYYKKRPELMKLVEEFYRAYRALAERYDHATGVIRHAHKTMSEHQVPFIIADEGPGPGSDPPTPEIHPPSRASLDPDELQKGVIGLSSGSFYDGGRGLRQLNGNGKARKVLDFDDLDDDGRSDNDVQALKDALARVEAEKEAGLLQYKKTLERLSQLESDISEANENSRGLSERADKAEEEVGSLKETLARVEAERDASFHQYRDCLEKISNLEEAESESEFLKEELARLKAEKEALLSKYMEALERIANLENKLLLAEDYVDNAGKEVGTLKETIARLTDEREAAIVNYKQSLEKIAGLEREIALMKAEVEDGVAKLKGSEEECHLLSLTNRSLEFEVGELVKKMGDQKLELSEKENELVRLRRCVEDERTRFTETETAFRSLQDLHSKVEEELGSVAGELQQKVRVLKEMEARNLSLEHEVSEAKKEGSELGWELELRVDERNALQQEIYCMKDELSSLKLRSDDQIADLVEKLGVMEKLVEKKEVLESSLSELKAELDDAREKVNLLEQSCQLLHSENGTLVTQLQITTDNLEKVSERNTFLENSVSDANAELEILRARSKSLEDSCRVLGDQNSTLVSELETTQHKLGDLEKIHADLEVRCSDLEEERRSALQKVEELKAFLENVSEANQTRVSDLEGRICSLELAGDDMRAGFEFDIFVLQKCVHDLRDKNFSLMSFFEKLLEASRMSEKLISELEESSRRQGGETEELRTGMFRLLEALETEVGPTFDDKRVVECILIRLESMKTSLWEGWDENQKLVVEKSVLVELLRQLKNGTDDLQTEMQKLLESNEELILRVREGNQREAVLVSEMKTLKDKLSHLHRDYDQLQKENHDITKNSEETEARSQSLFTELQRSRVCEMVIKDKYYELVKAYGVLKLEGCSKCKDIDWLKERVGVLEFENANVKTRSGADHEAVLSLRDAVASLEKHTVLQNEGHRTDGEDKQDAEHRRNGLFDLHEVRARIQAIEKAVIKLKQQTKVDRSTEHADSDLPMKQIEVLRSVSGSRRGSRRSSRRFDGGSAESASDLLMKDIMLDQSSDPSPYANVGPTDQIKELGVDQGTPKRKTLERLASDVRRLTDIRLAVEDLKEKATMTELYDHAGDRIAETEETVSKLFDQSQKLAKKIENSDGGDGGSGRSWSEQAGRISEKVGRLQMEVQKLQFVLMRRDSQETGKSGARVVEPGGRALLQDYLYGGGGSKSQRRRKRAHFCGCMRPTTKGD